MYIKTSAPAFTLASVCLSLLLLGTPAKGETILADHYVIAEFDSIPVSVIQAVKVDYNIFYVHTSHGSQIWTGIVEVQNEDPTYDPPFMQHYSDDLGHNGDTTWVAPTRSYLDTHPDCNMAMFSWCGGASDNTETGINIYLNKMDDLEQDYPGVTFIYMTGHLDGSGPSGNLYARNNQIRDYCDGNGKILFDFADIESYDPDGTYYPDESDYCNWCYDWCATHTCPSCACAHSQCFNCYQKGKAWWWMMATISGWNQQPDSVPNVVSVSPSANDLNVADSLALAATFDIDMDTGTLDSSTFVVHGKTSGLHFGMFSYDSPSHTAYLAPYTPFHVGEIVSATLTTGIQSAEGMGLDSSFAWSFTIAAGDGPGVFVLDSNYTVTDYPSGCFAADLNGDLAVDLATVGMDGVSVSLNNGDGTFAGHVLYSVGQWPHAIVAADLDRDGDIDLATANETGEYDCYLSIRLNNGDGTFASFATYPAGNVGSGPVSIIAADLDGDGDCDLATANYDGNTVSIIPNNGDGSFGDFSSYPVGDRPHSVVAGDLDRDGDFDLAVANAGSDDVSVLLNNRDGTFAGQMLYAVGNDPHGIVAADLNGDGSLDLATANDGSDSVSVLLNNGPGTFAPRISYAAGGQPHSVWAADIDGDADLDLATANYDTDNASVLLNDGGGSFALDAVYPVGDGPKAVLCADLDGDDDLDLAIANHYVYTVSVLFNESTPCCVVRGDIDHDGADLVDISDLVYMVDYMFNAGPQPPCLEEADVNGDGARPIDIADQVYLVDYMFNGGPEPPPCPRMSPRNPFSTTSGPRPPTSSIRQK